MPLQIVWLGAQDVATGTHAPVLQTSFAPQSVPFGAAGFVHDPVIGLQAPPTWQASRGAQATRLLPVHVPAWHVSVWVQALPSLQFFPSGAAGLAPAHIPATHASACVHAFPSSQTVPSGRAGFAHFPVAGLHAPAR